MYARLQTSAYRPETDDPEKLIRGLTEMISAHPGFAGLTLLEREDGGGTLLTLWHTREDAELAPERTRAVAGPRPFELLTDDVYEVGDDSGGPAGGGTAEAALVAYFDRPLSESAMRRGREKVVPVISQVPGLVRTLMLRHTAAERIAVVHLVTSPGGVTDIITAATSVPIADDEDPAELIGPDRAEPHRVLAYLPQ